MQNLEPVELTIEQRNEIGFKLFIEMLRSHPVRVGLIRRHIGNASKRLGLPPVKVAQFIREVVPLAIELELTGSLPK